MAELSDGQGRVGVGVAGDARVVFSRNNRMESWATVGVYGVVVVAAPAPGMTRGESPKKWQIKHGGLVPCRLGGGAAGDGGMRVRARWRRRWRWWRW